MATVGNEARNLIDGEAENLVGLTKVEFVGYLMGMIDSLEEKDAQKIFHGIAGKSAKRFSF